MSEILILAPFEAYPDGLPARFEAGETVAVAEAVSRVGDMVTAVDADTAAQWVAKGLAVADEEGPSEAPAAGRASR